MCIISENEFISLQSKTHVQDKHTIGTAIDREHSALLIIVCDDNRKAIVCVAVGTRRHPTPCTTTSIDANAWLWMMMADSTNKMMPNVIRARQAWKTCTEDNFWCAVDTNVTSIFWRQNLTEETKNVSQEVVLGFWIWFVNVKKTVGIY